MKKKILATLLFLCAFGALGLVGGMETGGSLWLAVPALLLAAACFPLGRALGVFYE